MGTQVILVNAVNPACAVAAPSPCVGNTVEKFALMPFSAIQFSVTSCVTRLGATRDALTSFTKIT